MEIDNEQGYETGMSEQEMINEARMEMAYHIVNQDIEVEDVVAYLEEREASTFDPFHIAMDWPKHTPHTTPGIAWGLFHQGYGLTIERIELVKICLEAMDNWGREI